MQIAGIYSGLKCGLYTQSTALVDIQSAVKKVLSLPPSSFLQEVILWDTTCAYILYVRVKMIARVVYEVYTSAMRMRMCYNSACDQKLILWLVNVKYESAHYEDTMRMRHNTAHASVCDQKLIYFV